MPIGKNASYRYRLIDLALRNRGRRYTFEGLREYICEKLAEEFDIFKGISKRQLEDDIRIMKKDPPEGFGAPIKRKYGEIYYEDPDFSINDNPLIESDIESLNEILRLIKPFQALPHFHELETIIGKVKGAISKNEGEEIILLDHNPDAKGLHHLEGLYKLIKDEKVISLNYHPFKREQPYWQTIHPYLIKEYNNRWFLMGWDPQEKRFSFFGLDRILEFKTVQGRINKEKKAELINLQKLIIGISLPEKCTPKKIKLQVNSNQLPYLLTKPLHSTQKVVKEIEDGAILTLEVLPNYELEQMILRLGEKVIVLAPVEFRNRIKERVESMQNNYFS